MMRPGVRFAASWLGLIGCGTVHGNIHVPYRSPAVYDTFPDQRFDAMNRAVVSDRAMMQACLTDQVVFASRPDDPTLGAARMIDANECYTWWTIQLQRSTPLAEQAILLARAEASVIASNPNVGRALKESEELARRLAKVFHDLGQDELANDAIARADAYQHLEAEPEMRERSKAIQKAADEESQAYAREVARARREREEHREQMLTAGLSAMAQVTGAMANEVVAEKAGEGTAPGAAEIAEMKRNVKATLGDYDKKMAQNKLAKTSSHTGVTSAQQPQQGKQQQAVQAKEKLAAENQKKLDDCLARPISQVRVAQTNPFIADREGFESLLVSAQRCMSGTWQTCMFSPHMGALWSVEDRAESDHADLFRRFNAPDVHVGGSSDVCLDQSVKGTRAECETDVTINRGACIARLKQDIDQMDCDLGMLPRVWEVENANRDALAKAKQDAACHRQLD